MKKIKADKVDFEALMAYCLVQRGNGKMRYMFELSLPIENSIEFFSWIKTIEEAGLEFSMWSIERYENHTLFYGFSDFCIKEFGGLKVFYFCFENEEVLYNNFCRWNEESSACIVSDSIVKCIEDVYRITE
ncbi:MAG: hypothetical protein IKY78_06940 [Clostridia bacterium]|nr:hypothetical protein [Clostridia bacterium]